jgi:V8-like Glu-specific endopeptidase
MRPKDVDEVAAALLQGRLPETQAAQLAAAVRQIADSLASVDPGFSVQHIRNAMKALNGARHFEHTMTIGDEWSGRHGVDPTVHKRFAQALIELGAFDKAKALLEEALTTADASTDRQFTIERPEYHGLLGRIRKQQYLQSGDVNDLVAATDQYLQQCSAKRQWHGINVVALRTLEERLQLGPRPGKTVAQLAHEVLALAVDAHARNSDDHWPPATASEACLALHVLGEGHEWCDKGELWLHRFLSHPNTDPFSIESYSRQVREIWRGNPLGGPSCADRFASIIERHVRRTERRWSVDAHRVQEIRDHPELLEKNFSGEKTFTISTLRQMLGLCQSIGCVINAAGVRLGTGFLMPGATFAFDEPFVFVTNAHVISNEWKGSIKPADARVTFEVESAAAGKPVSHAVKDVLFTSLPGDLSELSPSLDKLDVTIVSLASLPANPSGLTPADKTPLPSPKTKAFVVGHPLAGALQFSLHDSVLLDVCDHDRLMHYRTPTDPGSSGSPVFNTSWEVIALHHAGSATTPRLHGSGEYEANEGISLPAIRRKLRAV